MTTMKVTVWAAQNLVEMSKAQLVAVWGSQERLTYAECMLPKTKRGIILSILSWQEARGL